MKKIENKNRIELFFENESRLALCIQAYTQMQNIVYQLLYHMSIHTYIHIYFINENKELHYYPIDGCEQSLEFLQIKMAECCSMLSDPGDWISLASLVSARTIPERCRDPYRRVQISTYIYWKIIVWRNSEPKTEGKIFVSK